MRPTLLNFRSPKEKTPEFYNAGSITREGEPLNFRPKSLNKRRTVLPQADRFPVKNFFNHGSGVSAFLGPGSYNDHDDFIKLVKIPCSVAMVG